jgi:hypothetical protein
MLDLARIIGGFSALVLLVAVAKWVLVYRRGEAVQRKGAPALKGGRVLEASRLGLASAGLAAMAAVLAIAEKITV